LKWQIRRIVDKAALILVSIKPVRWFFDQLIKFGDWAQSKPRLAHIWKWISKLWKPFWIGYGSFYALVDAWNHDWIRMAFNIILVLVWVFMPERDDPDDEDEDEPDDPDPTPNGDAVDMWLKEQQKVNVQ